MFLHKARLLAITVWPGAALTYLTLDLERAVLYQPLKIESAHYRKPVEQIVRTEATQQLRAAKQTHGDDASPLSAAHLRMDVPSSLCAGSAVCTWFSAILQREPPDLNASTALSGPVV